MDNTLIKNLVDLNSEMVKSVAFLTETVQHLQASNLAYRAAIFTLIHAHSDPKAVFTRFADYVDMPATNDESGQANRVQAELQSIQAQIVRAVNQQQAM